MSSTIEVTLSGDNPWSRGERVKVSAKKAIRIAEVAASTAE